MEGLNRCLHLYFQRRCSRVGGGGQALQLAACSSGAAGSESHGPNPAASCSSPSCFFCSVGVFCLGVPLEGLFFVGSQLIATSHTGKIGVWNAVTKHWQVMKQLGIPSSVGGWLVTRSCIIAADLGLIKYNLEGGCYC